MVLCSYVFYFCCELNVYYSLWVVVVRLWVMFIFLLSVRFAFIESHIFTVLWMYQLVLLVVLVCIIICICLCY